MPRLSTPTMLGGTLAGMMLVLVQAGFSGEAAAADADPAYSRSIRTILEEGLHPRKSLASVAAHVARARSLSPGDPVSDYAYGLVLLKRSRYDQSLASFRAAVKKDPTYLPAWKGLFRLRLIRKEVKPLLSDAVELAELVQNPQIAWSNERQRQAGAMLLGRLSGYLAKPDIKFINPANLEAHEIKIEDQLGSEYLDAYFEGMQSLAEDYDALKADLETALDRKADRLQLQAAEKMAELEDRRRRSKGKVEAIRLTGKELKNWVDEQIKEADKSLATLQKDYSALFSTADGVSRLIAQTRVDISRVETEIEVRGLQRQRGPQPALVQLQQELLRYQDQLSELQQRAAQLLAQGRAVLAARTAAVDRYQKVTGELVRESEAVNRWNRVSQNIAMKAKRKAELPRHTKGLTKRLISPSNYFPLDYNAEMKRLLDEQELASKSE